MIAQSGSAVTPWGFEDVAQHTYHAKRWASLVNCDKEDVREMIQCLKAVPSEELSSATGNYSVSSHFCTLSQKNWKNCSKMSKAKGKFFYSGLKTLNLIWKRKLQLIKELLLGYLTK